MRRCRFTLPPGRWVEYEYLDILHDALVTAWTAQGVPSAAICGETSEPWNFAPLGYHKGKTGRAHTLVVSTPSTGLAEALGRMQPEDIRYARAATGEWVNFAEATRQEETDPVLPGQTVLSVFLLSPLAIRQPDRRWHARLGEVDLDAVVNRRLSRLAGRPVNLKIAPDSLYLRANPRHSVRVSLKAGAAGRTGFVIGMQAPLILSGADEDLRLAWHAGLGEKTRNGFGCIGAFERGLGR